MKTEVYAGRKISARVLKGNDYGRTGMTINGESAGHSSKPDVDGALAELRAQIDGVDRFIAEEGVDGSRWEAKWLVPGTYETDGCGHPRDIGRTCQNSWCLKEAAKSAVEVQPSGQATTSGEDAQLLPETMEVTVRDRASEAPWGSGWTTARTCTVTISAFCPICGGRRGEPRGLNSCDDGHYYWVQTWENPCGHRDGYVAVLAEAKALEDAVIEAAAHRVLALTCAADLDVTR